MKKLVLLAGLDGTGQLFEPLIKNFENNINVQIVTYPPNHHLSIEALANKVQSEVIFNNDTILLAESFSGLVAMELLRKGILLDSIIFCASFASAPRPLLLKFLNLLPLGTIFKLPLPNILLRLEGLNKELTELFQQVIKKVSPQVLAHRLRLIANSKNIFQKNHFKIHCYYLHGLNDWAVPLHCAKELEKYFKNVNVIHIEKAGHFVLQSQPQVCAKTILEIMK